MNLLQFQKKFSDEQVCIDWYAEQRWGKDNAICPHCKSNNHCKHNTRNIYTCLDCKKQYTVKIGTIFEDSKLSTICRKLKIESKDGKQIK